MTGVVGHGSAFPRHHARELCQSFRPEKQRAQGRPGARCTRGLACKSRKKTHTSIQVQRKQSGLPCAMVLTVSFVLSPVTGLLSPSPPRSLLLANLTPAPGRQDHTTSPSASASLVSRAFASTASHPDVRDDGQRPLVRDETALNKPVIWVERKRKDFSLRGWTGPSPNWPSGKSLRVFAFIPGSPLKFIRHSPMRNCAPENDERERGRWWVTPSASLRI